MRRTILSFALMFACTPESDMPAETAPQEGGGAHQEAPCRPELYGMNIDPRNPAGWPGADPLLAAGVKWVRFVFKTEADDLEAAFAVYDGPIAELSKSGISVMLDINYETVSGKPAAGDPEEVWEDYTRRYAEAAGAIAGRYGDQVVALELWNEQDEPNPRPEYDPTLPAARYGVLLQRSHDAIRGAGSGATIVTGGADSGNAGYLVEAGEATGRLYADAVGLHPYGQRAPNDYPSPDWGFGNYTDIVQRYHDATGLPVWITEIGTEEEDFQADYLFQIYATTRAYFTPDVVPHVFWFAWSDGMVTPFGLLHADGSQKDSYRNYAEETAWGNAGCGG